MNEFWHALADFTVDLPELHGLIPNLWLASVLPPHAQLEKFLASKE